MPSLKPALGLIGGIATGKTLTAQFFEGQGIEVIDTDQIARTLVAKGTSALAHIVAHFGPDILTPHHELNRAKLRQLIFNEPSKRLWLEHLLHPMIRKQVQAQVATCKSPYCVVAIPLLRQRESYPFLNPIVYIASDQATQIARLITRDAITKAEAEAIIKTQPSHEEFSKLADIIIVNSGNKAQLEQQLLLIHQQMLAKLNKPGASE